MNTNPFGYSSVFRGGRVYRARRTTSKIQKQAALALQNIFLTDPARHFPASRPHASPPAPAVAPTCSANFP